MQQRQLRLGDILDDYCPRERRLTNHAVVAMIGADVKQTRCTTCDAEHEYKHAQVPRQRRKADSGLSGVPVGSGPKRVVPGAVIPPADEAPPAVASPSDPADAERPEITKIAAAPPEAQNLDAASDASDGEIRDESEEGPVHRPLIRATLPRPEGQPPPGRPGPDFTIRHPLGRGNRFRSRYQRGEPQYHGNRSNGSGPGPMRSGSRQNPGRPPLSPRLSHRRGSGRKRSK
jgi:hypothetical protein